MTMPDEHTTPKAEPAAAATNARGDGASNHQTEPTDDLDTLRSELAELAQKADESAQKADDYLRLAQRTQADFVNYRRRMEEERAQQARDAGLTFIQRLLPVLDDFERALANAAPDDLDSNWGKGVLLVERNLRSVLAAEDVQKIEAEGAAFDPRQHEAVGREPTAAVPEGHIVHVVRPGYRKGERVIRPAQVIVAGPPGQG